MKDDKVMRTFESGATRDTSFNKPDPEAYFSPLVLEVRTEYMLSKQKNSDGTYREGDNWQKGFGENHLAVCMKSMWRHFLDLWFMHRGHKRFDKKDGHELTIEEVISALMFNAEAYLHFILYERTKK